MGKLFQSLFFAVNVFIQLKSNGDAMEAGDTLLLGASLTGNQTIISKNGTFELGFFTPNGSNWYIGICFDKPVDTLLLGMTFGGRQKLVSWKNSFDPTLGFFSLHMDPSGSKQFVLTWNNPIQYWESGTWDGKIYIGVPESEDKHYFYMSVEINSTDNRAWVSQDWVSSGCVRESLLNCVTDRFIDLGVTLPDDYASSYPASSKKHCQEACLRNFSLTAFRFIPPLGPCQIWSGDLLNMCNSTPSTSNSSVLIKRHQWRSMDNADSADSFLRMFSYKELKIATRNFRSKLGCGGFGLVFKGCLPDGTVVAVRKNEGFET
ncbi:hypothetical protein SUGI_0257600 [Cryptomeria japonica]|nr:hypothetical protein SUGI_0257600 [Cryptomeria japonica]